MLFIYVKCSFIAWWILIVIFWLSMAGIENQPVTMEYHTSLGGLWLSIWQPNEDY